MHWICFNLSSYNVFDINFGHIHQVNVVLILKMLLSVELQSLWMKYK